MVQAHYAPAASRRGFRFPTRDISVAGVVGALAAARGYTPLGFIAFPTPAGSATTMHIPVIVAGVLAGPFVGAFVGAVFGVISLLRAGTPAFSTPLIAIGPRILIGVVAALIVAALQQRYARSLSALALGAGVFTILGPGAQRFETAFAAKKIEPTWLINAYHAVAAVTSGQLWLTLAAGVAVAVLAYWLLSGAHACPPPAAVAGTPPHTLGVLALMGLVGLISGRAAFVPVGTQ